MSTGQPLGWRTSPVAQWLSRPLAKGEDAGSNPARLIRTCSAVVVAPPAPRGEDAGSSPAWSVFFGAKPPSPTRRASPPDPHRGFAPDPWFAGFARSSVGFASRPPGPPAVRCGRPKLGFMTGALQVSTTAENRETAAHLARSAVTARVAASAQVSGPVLSFFWHLGEQGEGEEWQVTLKTTVERYPALEQHLRAEHPWDNPEVTAVPLAAASAEYLAWLRKTVSPE